MAQQHINLGTPPAGTDGDTVRASFSKSEANFNELYAQVANAQSSANAALPKANPVFTGSIGKAGVWQEFCFRVSNVNTDQGIGGGWSEWTQNRTPALQVDAQSNTSAYMVARVTHWGARHLAAIDVYEGGSGTATPELDIHVGGTVQAFRFFQGGNATFAGTLTQNSDYRIKVDVLSIDPSSAAASLRSVRPVEYTDIREPEGTPRRAGMIAHELAESLPLLVKGQKDAVKNSTRMVVDTTPYMPG